MVTGMATHFLMATVILNLPWHLVATGRIYQTLSISSTLRPTSPVPILEYGRSDRPQTPRPVEPNRNARSEGP
jgi:hypothetical protein